MRLFISIALSCCTLAVSADELPAALKPVAQFAGVQKQDNLTAGTVVYQVNFCLKDGDCAEFSARPEDAQPLADFAILFARYRVGNDYFDGHNPAGTPQITPAQMAALADAAMESNLKKYSCQDAKNRPDCVLHGLFTAGGLKRYSFSSGDADEEREVDEDGNPLE